MTVAVLCKGEPGARRFLLLKVEDQTDALKWCFSRFVHDHDKLFRGGFDRFFYLETQVLKDGLVLRSLYLGLGTFLFYFCQDNQSKKNLVWLGSGIICPSTCKHGTVKVFKWNALDNRAVINDNKKKDSVRHIIMRRWGWRRLAGRTRQVKTM